MKKKLFSELDSAQTFVLFTVRFWGLHSHSWACSHASPSQPSPFPKRVRSFGNIYNTRRNFISPVTRMKFSSLSFHRRGNKTAVTNTWPRRAFRLSPSAENSPGAPKKRELMLYYYVFLSGRGIFFVYSACGCVVRGGFENIITKKGLVVHSALGRQDLWRAGTKWSNTKSFCNAGVAASEYTLLSAHGVMPGPEMRLAPDLTSPRAHYRAIMKTLYYLGMRVSRSLGSRHDFWPLAPHGGDDLFGEPYKHTRLVLS